MKDPIVFPTERTAPVRINPQSLTIYGPYKVGKTDSASAIPGALTLELQRGGADYCAHGRILDITGPEHLLQVLAELTAARAAKSPVCDRIVVDHLGELDDWLFDLALAAFKRSPIGSGKYAELQRITDLPSAGGSGGSPGWAWYWQELGQMHYKIMAAANEVIYISHVRDKAIRKEVGDVVVEDIDLTGQKARRLFCGRSSAIGFMFRRHQGTEDQLVLSFKTSEAVLCGCSPPHLSGREFVIGRSTNGNKPTYDWSAVFPAGTKP